MYGDEWVEENGELVFVRTDGWYKEEFGNAVWWKDTDQIGEFSFSFDKKNIFHLFADYPYKLTPEQKEIFDKENPNWVEFFKGRQ